VSSWESLRKPRRRLGMRKSGRGDPVAWGRQKDRRGGRVSREMELVTIASAKGTKKRAKYLEKKN